MRHYEPVCYYDLHLDLHLPHRRAHSSNWQAPGGGLRADVATQRQAGTTVSNAHVWRAAQDRLRQQMTRAQFDTWLRGTWLVAGSDGTMVLCVRTTFARQLLETRYRELIERAIAEVTGQSCVVQVAVATAEPDEPQEQLPSSGEAAPSAGQLSERHVPRFAQQPGGRPTLFSAEDSAQPQHAEPEPGSARNSDLPAGKRSVVISGGRRRIAPGGSPPGLHGGRVRAALERVRAADQADPSGERAGEFIPPLDQASAALDDEHEPETDFGDMPDLTSGQWNEASPQRERIDGTASMNGYGNPRDGHSQPGGSAWNYADRPGNAPRMPVSAQQPVGSGAPAGYTGQVPQLRLNPRYTFSTFIVGSGNQLAHAASQAVAEAPGQAYNPLFLYGGVGLGKTHLLHAVGHTAIAHDLVVLYVSSETFTNEIINAIRYRTTEEFRAKYRSVDVLLVDDIQFIAGKESTEEEFFHTFNTLYENSKQIVICSDRPPKAIVSLEERLRSRFEWGLIADIQPPDLETRVAILRAKADMMGRHVPDDVINYLASRVQSNIRELEGSFNRLFAFAQLQGLPLSIDTAKAALASLATDGRPRRVSVGEVLETVAEYYRVTADDLCGKQRDKHIVVPRQVAMYLMRQETEASLMEIGQALGGRDHSTVLHGCEKIGREVNENTALRKEVLAIRQQLLG